MYTADKISEETVLHGGDYATSQIIGFYELIIEFAFGIYSHVDDEIIFTRPLYLASNVL